MNDFFSDHPLPHARMATDRTHQIVIVDAGLQGNIDAFCAQLDGLLPAHLGKYVVYANAHLFKVFNSLESALTAGYENFAADSFMVQRVEPLRAHIDFQATCQV
ncbi:hypothetical protein [Polaromonas sp.]|uniref:hypothetical protein n=1 Tax=Polaromonas sp. TaxID=1869339 RepID=UPI003C9F3BCC